MTESTELTWLTEISYANPHANNRYYSLFIFEINLMSIRRISSAIVFNLPSHQEYEFQKYSFVLNVQYHLKGVE